MPTRIDNLTPFAAELLDFGGAAPTAGKGLVWDGEGKLVAADVVVQSDLAAYATISSVTSALATKADASALTAHVEADDNPHGVTAEQVGAYTTAQVDGLISAITYSDVGAAAAEHSHAISDVTGLQTALDGKADLSGATFTGGVAAKGSLTLNPAASGPAVVWTLFVGGENAITGAEAVYWTDTGVMRVGSWNAAVEMVSGNLYVDKLISESGQPLRERYVRHFLNLESKSDLATLDAAIGDQATVQTGDANDPIHRYELMGDVTETGPEVDFEDEGQAEGWPTSFTVYCPGDWPGPASVTLGVITANTFGWDDGGDLSVTVNATGGWLQFVDDGNARSMTFSVNGDFPPTGVTLTDDSSGGAWQSAAVAFANQSYDTPAENLANWRRIVTLDADGEIKGPILHRFVLDTDDTDVARIGEIVCVVDDLDNPTTASYRMGDGTTKTANLPEIATATP